MKSSVETLEGNKVKVIVEVEEAEFEKDLDVAFSKLAGQVKLPGFRKGKAPRKVLEAHIGQEYARDEAFREALPNYYSEAVKEHEVDVIAPPEIDITDGMESGPVSFDAVVEVRPAVEIDGYTGLEVEIPKVYVSEDDVDEAVDRMRQQFSELVTVDRAAAKGDRAVINIAAEHEGEAVPGMTADDYVYEVGSGATGIDEIDEELEGASAGDELSFSAKHPTEEEAEPLQFTITVNEIQEALLPEPTDEWVKENSEFETHDALRADYREKMEKSRKVQGHTARRNKVAETVAELVSDDDVPEAMIEGEVENRVQDMAMRLQAQGLSFEQYMQFSGQDQASMVSELRAGAKTASKLDLALRAIAERESLEVTDEEIADEFDKVADQFDRPVEEVKADLAAGGQLPAVRADLLKTKTLDWLVEQTKVVDEDGQQISPDALELPEEDLEEE